MDIFQTSTPAEISPEAGHENQAAELENSELEQQEQIDSQDLQPEADQEQTQDEAPSEEEHGDLLAGKYKTPQELEKAYKNLQSEFTKTRQQMKQPTQQPVTPQQGDDPNDVFWNAFQNDPLGTFQYLVNHAVEQRTAPLEQQRQTEKIVQNLDKLSQEYQQVATPDGLKLFQEKMYEIAEEEWGQPNLAANPSPRLMKLAAQELWGDSKAALYQKAKQKGREEAEQARRAKQGLSAPSGAKPKETPKSAEDEIADSIVNAGRQGGIFGR